MLGSKNHYWWIAAQVQSARIRGILPKTIVALGVGKGGNPGEDWARTKEEIEQQIRFVRFICGPESPGIGFYSGGDWPQLIAKADEVCGHYFDLPTDGSGLPADVVAAAKVFTDRHAKPTLVLCPDWVEPNRSGANPSDSVQPLTMRAYILNLGDQDATNVQVRLRNTKDKGDNVFAVGVVPVIPKHEAATATLPFADWSKVKSWKTWGLEVEAPGCEVVVYKR